MEVGVPMGNLQWRTIALKDRRISDLSDRVFDITYEDGALTNLYA
jgi:hypothetical protein